MVEVATIQNTAMNAGVIIRTRKKAATKPSTSAPAEVALMDDYRLFFSIPEPPGSIQAECRENHMPGIEEPEKHKEVQQLDAHGEERSE